MKSTRIWISAGVLVLIIVGMIVFNSLDFGPKGPPDVQLEGRLAHLNEPRQAAGDETAAEKVQKDEKQQVQSQEDESEEKTIEAEQSLTKDEENLIAGAEGSVVKLDTEKGDIYLELYDQKTPITAGNFLELVDSGFYDGLTFHRVIEDFMVQAGCPKGDGTGGPGFTIPDEVDAGLKHKRGSLSMAKTQKPDTGGSQFFICRSPQPHLDGKHAVFGECIDGMDVVDSIQKGDSINSAVILHRSAHARDAVQEAKDARVPE